MSFSPHALKLGAWLGVSGVRGLALSSAKKPAGLPPLILSHPRPVGAARLSRRNAASTGRRGVQDRSVQQRVNNLVVGHAALPLFNTPNLTAGPRNGYGAKREIVQ